MFEINKKTEGIYAVIDLQATPEAVAAARTDATAVSAVEDWIRAPKPERTAAPHPPAAPAVGLDEVAAATSIKPLIRFGPSGASAAQPFTLVSHGSRSR